MNIAIVIPSYNELENIKKLIESILIAIKNPKIVIVDDSLNKDIEEITKNFDNINYILLQNDKN